MKRITRDPTQGSSTPSSTNSVAVSQVGEQMCQMQADIRSLNRQSKEVIEINRSMLEEQQEMRKLTKDLLEKIDDTLKQLTTVIENNDKNTDDILELLYHTMDENQINMEFMNGSIEVIAQAALTLAYVNGNSDDEIEEAKKKATADLMKDKPQNDELRKWIRAVLESKYAEARKKKLEDRKST